MADEKILERVRKLFAIAEGSSNSKSDSAEIANEALAALMMARKLLAKHHIDESEIAAKAEAEHFIYVPPSYGISLVTNPHKRANARGLNQRRIWFEKLADVIAEGNYCKIGIKPYEGAVSFYGLEMDREICTFSFISLAKIAANLCQIEMKKVKANAGGLNFGFGSTGGKSEKIPVWTSDDCFIESFHQGFREEIRHIFSEDGNGKQSEGVQAFWLDNCSYYDRPENIWHSYQFKSDDEDIEIEEYYVNIGKKVAENAAAKLKLDEGTENLQGLIKTNLVQKQEKARKVLEEKYKLLGIDESLPPEVFIALDSSGSMGGEGKMNQAKDGAINYAKDANAKGYKVGLVTFGARFNDERIINPSDKVNGEFTEFVGELEPYDSTPMAEAITKANNYFKQSKARRFLVIVTDGAPNSREAALQSAKEAKDNGVIIQCIGTHDAPKDFLDQLSSSGKGLLVGNNALGEGIRKMAGLLGS